MNPIAKSVNSLKHGITSKTLLRCRGKNCFYFNHCHIREDIASYPYGEFCPIEEARMRKLWDSYTKELTSCNYGDNELIRDLVLADLKKMRLENLVSMTAVVPGCVGNDQVIAPHVLLRYYNELANERMKLYCRAKSARAKAKEGAPPSC